MLKKKINKSFIWLEKYQLPALMEHLLVIASQWDTG